MASIPTTIPSASQMLELASNLPPEKPPPPSEAHVLLGFVDLCSTTWIRDFLFSPDPLHVQHFASTSSASSALVAHHSCTMVDAPCPSPAGPLFGESRHTEGALLFSPAFTVGHVTVGFGIMDSLLTLGAPWLPEGRVSHPLRFICRFVRDMSRDLIFMMYDVPYLDSLLVHCARLEQTTCLNKFDAVLRRRQLLESIHSGNGCLSTEKLVRSLQFLNHEVQYRPCYVCGSPPSAFCGCFIPIHEPEHPFDLHHFTSGMLRFFGERESVMSKIVYGDEQQKRHLVLASRTTTQGISAPSVAQKLKTWALTEHAQRMKEHPWKSPSLILSEGSLSGDLFGGQGRASDHILWITEIHDASVAIADARLDQSSRSVAIPYWSPNMAASGVCHSEVESLLPRHAVCDADDLVAILDSQPVPELDGLQDENKGTSGQHHRIPATPVIRRGDTSELRTLATNITTEEIERASAIESETSPHGAVQRHRNSDDCEEASITADLKEEIRKERNRASARRCNMRNKVMREELKLELRKCDAKVAQLRAKEVELRRENIRLRSLLPEIDKQQMVLDRATRVSEESDDLDRIRLRHDAFYA